MFMIKLSLSNICQLVIIDHPFGFECTVADHQHIAIPLLPLLLSRAGAVVRAVSWQHSAGRLSTKCCGPTSGASNSTRATGRPYSAWTLPRWRPIGPLRTSSPPPNVLLPMPFSSDYSMAMAALPVHGTCAQG